MAVTWNPSDKAANITLSNGDLTATMTNDSWGAARATLSKASGKWYWEIRVDAVGVEGDVLIFGVGTSAATLSSYVGSDAYGYGYFSYNGTKTPGQGAYGNTYTTGDIIGIALDLDNGKIWFSKNNTWQDSGDPVAGTNEAFSGISGTFFPMFSAQYDPAAGTARFDGADLTYIPPAGFSPLEGTAKEPPSVAWNPDDKSANLSLFYYDLTAKTINTAWSAVRAEVSKDSGKWYWEVRIVAGISNLCIGIGTSSASLDFYPGADSYGRGYHANGNKYHSASGQSYGATYVSGDTIGVALDLDNGKIWWSKNGTWQASGDPEAGTGEAYSGLSGTFFPMAGAYSADNMFTGAFRVLEQIYALPSGFTAYEYTPIIYYFSGNVFEQQVPVSRILYLYDRPTGALVTTTTSASGTGYYYMETISSGSHNIVCLDDDFGINYNDLISGNVFPTTTSG